MKTEELISAIEESDLDTINKLLLSGVDPNVTENDTTGWTALHIAVEVATETNCTDGIKLLLKYGADVNKWNDSKTTTPLIIAVFNNNDKATKILLDSNANPCVQSSQGDSPLRRSVEEKYYKIVKLLLDGGAKNDIDSFGGDFGLTPLGIAASNLDIEMIKLLISEGANLYVYDDDYKIAQQRLPKYSEDNRIQWENAMELLSD